MSDPSPTDVAPEWAWLTTAVCAVLAVGVHVVGGVAYETAVGVLVAATAVGVLYLLYRWGQVRETEPDEESEREKEVQAEVGSGGML